MLPPSVAAAHLRPLPSVSYRNSDRLLACDTCGINDEYAAPTYAGYRFPAEIIAHAVWLYFRFALS